MTDPYVVARRIFWIRRKVDHAERFNCTDIVVEFGVTVRTAMRDIRFLRVEEYGDRLKYDTLERTYYLEE